MSCIDDNATIEVAHASYPQERHVSMHVGKENELHAMIAYCTLSACGFHARHAIVLSSAFFMLGNARPHMQSTTHSRYR